MRPGERWGVDVGGMGGSNKTRGFASTFGGIRLNPNIDLFGGFVYRNNSNYKDGSGTEVGNSNSEVAGGLVEAHDAAVGRPPDQVRRRRPELRLQHRPAEPRPDDDRGAARGDRRVVDLRFDRAELDRHGELALQQARRRSVRLECDVLRQSHRERSGQDLQQPHHHRRRHLLAGHCRATTSPAASATSAAIGSIRSAATSTTPRGSATATGATP